MTVLEYILVAIVSIGWFSLAAMMVGAAWRGRFPAWRRRASEQRWPPFRNEAPVRFWLVWSALAWPFLILPLFALTGLAMSLIAER